MIRRFVALTVAGGLAAIGYVGAHRLGRWLDGPLVDVPRHAQPSESADTSDPSSRREASSAGSGTGWRRWSPGDESTS